MSKVEATIDYVRGLIEAVGRREAAQRAGLNVRSLDNFHVKHGPSRWRPTSSTLRKLEAALGGGDTSEQDAA